MDTTSSRWIPGRERYPRKIPGNFQVNPGELPGKKVFVTCFDLEHHIYLQIHSYALFSANLSSWECKNLYKQLFCKFANTPALPILVKSFFRFVLVPTCGSHINPIMYTFAKWSHFSRYLTKKTKWFFPHTLSGVWPLCMHCTLKGKAIHNVNFVHLDHVMEL